MTLHSDLGHVSAWVGDFSFPQLVNLMWFFRPFQSILELEKERIKLLYNNLNQYTQHISVFGQTLTTVSSTDFSISDKHGKNSQETFSSNLVMLSWHCSATRRFTVPSAR